MRTKQIVLVGFLLATLIGVQSASANDWSLGKLNPFAKEEVKPPAPRRTTIGADRGYRYQSRAPEPSAWEKFDAGTKKFFGDTKKALTWKKPAPKKQRPGAGLAWIQSPKEEKQSWFSSLFAPKEPTPAKSMQEFLGMPRPEF